MLNLKFNLRLTAKRINNWKKSHKPIENATTLIRKIADHYGLNNQKLKLQEELGELITASAKSDADHLVEEMADVSIMIEQVVYLLKKESLFAETREKKIGRQIKRIEEEEK
jgi:NTP pyrophosphatase (non-canonical NTP hydrolase)